MTVISIQSRIKQRIYICINTCDKPTQITFSSVSHYRNSVCTYSSTPVVTHWAALMRDMVHENVKVWASIWDTKWGRSPAHKKTAHSNTSTELQLKINTAWKWKRDKKNRRNPPLSTTVARTDACTTPPLSATSSVNFFLSQCDALWVLGLYTSCYSTTHTQAAQKNKWLR